MSKSLFIEYRGDGFWACDVATGVFLKHLIDRTLHHIERQPSAWLSDCIKRWRVNAVVSDLGVYLDPEWTDGQRGVVRSLIEEACHDLQRSESIPAEEAASWNVLDGKGIFARGASRIPTAPSVALGRAIALLLESQLPPAPSRSWWFYGTENGITTIPKNA